MIWSRTSKNGTGHTRIQKWNRHTRMCTFFTTTSSGTFRPPQDGFLTAMRVQAGARGRAAALAATGGGGNTTIDAARAVEIFLAKRRHKKRYGVQQLQQQKHTAQLPVLPPHSPGRGVGADARRTPAVQGHAEFSARGEARYHVQGRARRVEAPHMGMGHQVLLESRGLELLPPETPLRQLPREGRQVLAGSAAAAPRRLLHMSPRAPPDHAHPPA